MKFPSLPFPSLPLLCKHVCACVHARGWVGGWVRGDLAHPRDSMLPALLPSGAPVPVMSDSTQDRLNVSHSERDFSVANDLKLDLSS